MLLVQMVMNTDVVHDDDIDYDINDEFYDYVDAGDEENDLKKISYTAAIATATAIVPYSGSIVPHYSFRFLRFVRVSLFPFVAHRTLCSSFSFLCMSRSPSLSHG